MNGMTIIGLMKVAQDNPKFEEFLHDVVDGHDVETLHVLDVDGNPLVKDGIYMYFDEKVQITHEQFGSGNWLDTYYHVYYRRTDFSTSSLCISVKNKKYSSSFKKVEDGK